MSDCKHSFDDEGDCVACGAFIEDLDDGAVERIAELEAENEALGEKVERLESLARAVVGAVDALPVVEMIDGPADDPVLIGYAMQAQGEWDELRRNANALAEAIGGEVW